MGYAGSRMRKRLRFLYGDEVGDLILHELGRLLEKVPRRSAVGAPAGPRFDERDAILITYGDSIRAPGQRPLRVLGDFARKHLKNLVSTIHILPFFPYSSDYGFSVVDYLEVDRELGDWDDIAALHNSFKLMFDFVLNHVSAGSDWFQKYLHGEAPFDRFFIEQDPETDLSAVTRPRTTPLWTP